MDNTERPKEQFTTAKIRAMCRDAFLAGVPYALSIVTHQEEDAQPSVAMRALDLLGKYGVGPHPELLLDRADWLEIVIEVTKQHITDSQRFDAWWTAIQARLEDTR